MGEVLPPYSATKVRIGAADVVGCAFIFRPGRLHILRIPGLFLLLTYLLTYLRCEAAEKNMHILRISVAKGAGKLASLMERECARTRPGRYHFQQDVYYVYLKFHYKL